MENIRFSVDKQKLKKNKALTILFSILYSIVIVIVDVFAMIFLLDKLILLMVVLSLLLILSVVGLMEIVTISSKKKIKSVIIYPDRVIINSTKIDLKEIKKISYRKNSSGFKKVSIYASKKTYNMTDFKAQELEKIYNIVNKEVQDANL